MSSILKFKTLEIANFMSYGQSPSVFELDEQGTVCIEGINLDTGGSNGSGKSIFLNALCYALYNKAMDSITLQRLVNSTNLLKNTQMYVKLTFEKDGCCYEVIRSRGAEYKIVILRDGEDITPGKGAVECDAMLVDIIDISYEVFTKTIIFSGNSPAFLQLPLFQQRNQIEELFNITILSEKAVLLKEKIKLVEQDIKVGQAVIKQQEHALELQNSNIVESEERINRWEKKRIEDIREIEEILSIVELVDFTKEKSLHTERTKLKDEQFKIQAKLTPLKKDQHRLTHDIGKLLSEHDHLSDAKCPYCSQAFADAPAKLLSVDENIDSDGKKLLEVDEAIADFSEKLTAVKTRLSEVEAAIQYQDLDELLESKENASQLRKKVEDLKVSINPHIEAFEVLSSKSIIKVDYQKVDDLKKMLDHQQFLLKLLTDKNSFLRRRIINKNIPFLNNRLNYFTNALGLPHVVKFDADMSCTVSEFGRELDFGNLSAGEKKRLNTSLALAFRDVLHHLRAKTNLLLIDELDGALDQNGFDCVIKILKEKSRDDNLSIFVISHNPLIAGRLDKTLQIVKEQGFSSVVSN